MCKESPDGVRFIPRPAFREYRITGFAEAAVRDMQGEVTPLGTLKQLNRRRTLVVRRRGVVE